MSDFATSVLKAYFDIRIDNRPSVQSRNNDLVYLPHRVGPPIVTSMSKTRLKTRNDYNYNRNSNRTSINDDYQTSYRIGNGGRKVYKRKRIGQRMRALVASEQEWKCGDCQMTLNAAYEIDHIIPVCDGGTNQRENLVALCRNCHGLKTTRDGLKGRF